MIFLSHLTSSTALIFPVKEICEIARKQNIISIIDGAHVPGHIDLDILDINPDIYVGACHKWMCSPKGVSFLYAKNSIQKEIEPLVISWGWESDTPGESQFIDYHEYQGTNDISAYLTIPTILDFFKKNDWDKIRNKCFELILDVKNHFKDIHSQCMPTSNNNNHIAQMLSFKVNENSELLNNVKQDPKKIIEIQNKIFEYSNIYMPIIIWEKQIFLRVSINAYNTSDDVDAMFAMLKYFNLL